MMYNFSMFGKWIVSLFILLSASFLFGRTIHLSEVSDTHKQSILLLEQAEIAVSPPSSENLNRLMPPHSNLFRPTRSAFVHLGYTPKVLWVRFSLFNDTPTSKQITLHLSNQMLEHIFLYRQTNDGVWQVQKSGIMEKLSFDDGLLHPHFAISMEPNDKERFYLSIASESSALNTDVTLSVPESFERKEVSWLMAMSLFFGAMGALIFYNFFIFFFTRDIAYLYYVLYHLFAVVNYLSYTCFTNYLLPSGFWEVDAFLGVFYIGCTTLFFLLFVRTFLGTARYPYLDTGFKLLIAASLVLIAIGLGNRFHPFAISILVGASSILYALFVGIYLLRKGERNARLFTTGWIAASFGWISLALYDSGYWSPIYLFPYTYEAAMLIEAILFSIALAYKLNLTKELERSLKKNEFLLKELNHRVKNNMQFIVSLYRLKLSSLRSPGLSETLKEVEGSIQAMRSAHKMLYSQNRIDLIDLDAYIRTLVQHLQESFQADDIRFDLHIDAKATVAEAIHIGTILNELIVNAIKYAFPSGNGTISVKLLERRGGKILIFKDNGIGCKRAEGQTGFGMELIRMIVDEEFKGSLEHTPQNGCRYTISWSSREKLGTQ